MVFDFMSIVVSDDVKVIVKDKEVVGLVFVFSSIVEDDDFGVSVDGRFFIDEEFYIFCCIFDKIFWSIYIIVFVELCECFFYYGIIVVFINFIQQKLLDNFIIGVSYDIENG